MLSLSSLHSVSAAQESDEFREVLRDCCADIAHETSMELLQRYRDEAGGDLAIF